MTKIKLKRNKNTEFDISQSQYVLDKGEPFVDLSKKQLYIGDGVTKLNQLDPFLGGVGSFTAVHSYSKGIHTFTINENVPSNLNIFSFLSRFMYSYTSGQQINITINGNTFENVEFLTTSNISAVSNSFVNNTVSQLYVYRQDQNIQVYISPAVSTWSK